MVIKKQIFIVPWLFFYIVLVGCDPTKYAHGTLVSEARINIEFSESKAISQFYPLYIETASMGGFMHLKGRSGSYTLEELYSDRSGGGAYFLIWVENENSTVSNQHSVIFSTKLKEQMYANATTFIFQKGSTESFTKEEWLKFFQFKDEILPQIFPNADIRISETRHPAVFTDEETLRLIQTETDIEIPEKYLRSEKPI